MTQLKTEEVRALMKRCQIGVGGRRALDEAHEIMAECYGTLGALMLEVERLQGQIHARGIDSERWRWLVTHATIGFAGPPSHDAIIRLPTRGGESTVTELVDGWIQGARSV